MALGRRRVEEEKGEEVKTLTLTRARAVLAFAALGAGCAGPTLQTGSVNAAAQQAEAAIQQELSLRTSWEHQRRVNRVARKLLEHNTDICAGETKDTFGIVALSIHGVKPNMREAARRAFGLGDAIALVDVPETGPAYEAGLRNGDIIESVNGTPLPHGEQSLKTLAEVLATPPGSKQFAVRRGAEQLSFDVTPRAACPVEVKVQENSVVNAYTDGKVVWVTRGMMNFARTDEELALVLGHELAHVSLKHVESKKGNMVLGAIFDVLLATQGINTQSLGAKTGAQAYSQEFEKEADYQGLYYVARAGYPVENAAMFWRRMGVEHPSSIQASHSASHPSTPERFLGLTTNAEEIVRKRTSGLPLQPEKLEK